HHGRQVRHLDRLLDRSRLAETPSLPLAETRHPGLASAYPIARDRVCRTLASLANTRQRELVDRLARQLERIGRYYSDLRDEVEEQDRRAQSRGEDSARFKGRFEALHREEQVRTAELRQKSQLRVHLRLLNSTALSLVPLTTFYLCQIDAQSFQLLQCRLGMAFPGLVIAPLCVPDLGCRPGQLLLNLLGFGDPPGSHQGRHRRVELADRQLRIFFPPIAAALAPGTGSLPPTGLDGVSAPDSGDPRIDPSRSHSCRPRSIVPRATARRPPAARSLLGFPEVRCPRRI